MQINKIKISNKQASDFASQIRSMVADFIKDNESEYRLYLKETNQFDTNYPLELFV